MIEWNRESSLYRKLFLLSHRPFLPMRFAHSWRARASLVVVVTDEILADRNAAPTRSRSFHFPLRNAIKRLFNTYRAVATRPSENCERNIKYFAIFGTAGMETRYFTRFRYPGYSVVINKIDGNRQNYTCTARLISLYVTCAQPNTRLLHNDGGWTIGRRKFGFAVFYLQTVICILLYLHNEMSDC